VYIRLSRDPDTVRAPDIAFVSKARRPFVPPTGYADFAPDLVVEVASPNDDPNEIQSSVFIACRISFAASMPMAVCPSSTPESFS